ncbi:hypothetical protein FPQ18DRAFT_339890 [Pyronema domesticum]|uniref:Similar to AMSH-like protease sst2 acc. no. Q9P371 n=1 Tax=Pyronema omphalodes (strain CBS 100304) TaxID=1076935 RepID=U4LP16_PYROM|nr:hypothetical protein FPQ18DRAFT_339890 [Pyronema domesticum]CCX33302.1 Similar to AMSH-like protease sst2; acc. no. Q9P371 [Pyronema omphalodes CBS 100304]
MEVEYRSSNRSLSRRNEALPPKSTKELSEAACEFEFDPSIPLLYWFRTADNVLKEAKIYQQEGDDQHAFFLYMRFLELVYNKLDKHPDYINAIRNRNDPRILRLQSLRAQASSAMAEMEKLKPIITARYDAYHQKALNSPPPSSRIGKSTPSFSNRRSGQPESLNLSMQRRMSAISLTGPFSPPSKSGGQKTEIDPNIAVDIARQEYERRQHSKHEKQLAAARKAGLNVPVDSTGAEILRIPTPTFSPRPPVTPRALSHLRTSELETESERRTREALEHELDVIESVKALSLAESYESRPAVGRVQQIYSPVASRDYNISAYDFDGFPAMPDQPIPESPAIPRWQGSYPTIPKPQHSPAPYIPAFPRAPTPPRPPKGIPTIPPPPPPAKYEIPPPPIFLGGIPPPPPPKSPYYSHSHSPALPPKTTLSSAPDTPAVPFSTPSSLEDGTPLRTVFLPSQLRSTFLSIASPNTTRNLETCGILCGFLENNAFFISRLVIPEQTATSDTCTTKDEEGLFEYCDKEELMVLGWIHTHPTQTCFMSSVDCHTQLGYQCMMKEAIAVVVAPSKRPSWGVFRLTDPPGVQIIRDCTQKSAFHPHDGGDIYTDALSSDSTAGHVREVPVAFECVDLRKTKW